MKKEKNGYMGYKKATAGVSWGGDSKQWVRKRCKHG